MHCEVNCLEHTYKMKQTDASADATGRQAEYIRDRGERK
jgi:hypothetical protein